MFKPPFVLIHCSSVTSVARDRERSRGFRPLVIQGGAAAAASLTSAPWEAAFELIDQSFWSSQAIYVALGMIVLERLNELGR